MFFFIPPFSILFNNCSSLVLKLDDSCIITYGNLFIESKDKVASKISEISLYFTREFK